MADTKRPNKETERIVNTNKEQFDSTQEFLPGFTITPGLMIAGYRIGKKIGGGGESYVYLCTDPQNADVPFVMKIYHDGISPNEGVLQKMKHVDHPDVIKLIHYDKYKNHFIEVIEYAAGGSLNEQKLDEETITERIIPQVLNAFKYCHENGIIHRDMKPQNLFYRDTSRKDLVIGDFGLASAFTFGRSVHTKRIGFTLGYGAPELAMTSAQIGDERSEGQIFGPEVDYYGLGMTVMALLLGRFPFVGYQQNKILSVQQSGDLPMPDYCTPRFKMLLRGLLHPTPRKRWGYEQVSKWLRNEVVEVAEYDQLHTPFQYRLSKDIVAHSTDELARQMLSNPDIAKEHISAETFFNKIDIHDQPLAIELRKIVKHSKSVNLDDTLLEIIYTLDKKLPYRLADKLEANKPQELARLIDRDAASRTMGKTQLYDGRILIWLRLSGRDSVLKQWQDVSSRYKNLPDQGLEYFLHVLDSKLDYPRIKIVPGAVEFGRVEVGTQRQKSFKIQNIGRGYLSGVINLGKTKGLTVRPEQFEGYENLITVSFNAKDFPVGSSSNASLIIESNAQPNEVHVPVNVKVGYPVWSNIVQIAGGSFRGFSGLFDILVREGVIAFILVFGVAFLLHPWLHEMLDDAFKTNGIANSLLWKPQWPDGIFALITLGLVMLVLFLVWTLIVLIVVLVLALLGYLNEIYLLQIILGIVIARRARRGFMHNETHIANVRGFYFVMSVLLVVASLVILLKVPQNFVPSPSQLPISIQTERLREKSGNPNTPPAQSPTTDKQERQKPEIQRSLAALSIVTQPAGASVMIDGVSKGTAPLKVTLPIGDHIVIAELDGYKTRELSPVSVTDGREISIVLEIEIPDLMGTWKGLAEFNGQQSLEMILRNQDDEKITGTAVVTVSGTSSSSDLIGFYDAAGNRIILQENRTSTFGSGIYEGTLSADKKSIKGEWKNYSGTRTASWFVKR